jgi:cation diffusion facilitator family transporter
MPSPTFARKPWKAPVSADDRNAAAVRQIRAVTYLGAAANVMLAAVKLAIGLAVASLALVADGLHSLSDLSTDGAVLLGSYLGARKPDRTHPYGHGRLETFAAATVALVLVGVGGAMVYYATVAIAKGQTGVAHWGVLVGALLSIVTKEAVYRVTRRAAVESHSSVLYANAWHHRSDALSSVAVLIGYVLLRLGYEYGDHLAAVAVGLMVIFVGVRVIGDVLRELTEGAVDAETVRHIKEVIDADSAIRHWHRLRTRTVGREVFLDVHILVDPKLNVADAHDISERLEQSLDEQISRPVNITVHIEPDLPSLRR